MRGIRVKKSAAKGLRRTLWELLTPSAHCFSSEIAKFATIDTGTFTQGARDYHAKLGALAQTIAQYAWHQTILGNSTYKTELSKDLNRAERFLALQLLEFGHNVARNQLQKRDAARQGSEQRTAKQNAL